MHLSLYNTLTRNLEVFKPINSNMVKMYVCGPTVYDRPHIGNARSVVIYDILYSLLRKIFGANHVKYVRNITDVDDKIIERAKQLGIAISDLTATTTQEFHHDMAYLNCTLPNVEPKATEHIGDMIMLIQKLLDSKHAYIADNNVYFDVSSYSSYTLLSNRSFDEMLDFVRIEQDIAKKTPHDFVLWKVSHHNNITANTDSYVEDFDSPWGRGRPGWHIECSAMSYKYLGEDFDIHGGGADLIFPHHTNEIAQSKCAFPNAWFAKYWVHNGFLTCNGQKMSKSLGNFITVKDLIDKQIAGEIVRLFFISSHYRKPLDYNDKALSDAHKTINYWYRAIENIEIPREESVNLPDEFLTALLDDMNTPLAIKIINDYAKLIFTASNHKEKELYAFRLISCANFIGLLQQSAQMWFHLEIQEDHIKQQIANRVNAKAQKNWALADKIRADLLTQGIILEDKHDGTTVWRKSN